MKRIFIIFTICAIMLSGLIISGRGIMANSFEEGIEGENEDQTLMGDANLDGKITASDASLILRHLVGLDTLSEQGLINSDVDADGEVTAADAAMILRYIVRLIDGFATKPTPTPDSTESPATPFTESPTPDCTEMPYEFICIYCEESFGSNYEAWHYHAYVNPGHYLGDHPEISPTPTPIDDESTPTPSVIPTVLPTPVITMKPTATPEPTATVKPTATPTHTATPKPTPTIIPIVTPTPYVWRCKYCGCTFDSEYDWNQHAYYDPGCYYWGRDMYHVTPVPATPTPVPTPSPTPTPTHPAGEGHWEWKWVVDVPAKGHTVWVCNVCGKEFLSYADCWADQSEHLQNHDAPVVSWSSYTVIDEPEQGHWEQVWVPDD